jgi:hypothetical protein
MSKPRKKTPKPTADKPTPIYLRIDADTDRALTAFIAKQPAPPERTVVTLTALHEFLAKHGCWPVPDEEHDE